MLSATRHSLRWPARLSALLGWLVWAAALPAPAAEFLLEDTKPVKFGAPIGEVEGRLRERSFDMQGGRPGTDRMVATLLMNLYFDSGRLWRAGFKADYLLMTPLRPMAAAWQNPVPAGNLRIERHMKYDAFLEYLEAWRQAAASAGRIADRDYWIEHGGSPGAGRNVTIMFAPRRRLMGTGTLTGDTIAFGFSPVDAEAMNARFVGGKELERLNAERPADALLEVTVALDDFSTRGRETEEARGYIPKARRNGRPLAAPDELGGELRLDTGEILRFGQSLAETEKAWGVPSQPDTLPVSRPGVRRNIVGPAATLRFAYGRLEHVEFGGAHGFRYPVAPFSEEWQNPDPIDGRRIAPGMSRADFQLYLEAWRRRAAAAGKREDVDYSVGDGDGMFTHVALAPFRRTLNGRGIWSDSWAANFGFAAKGNAGEKLESVSVFSDAYNPNSRPAPGAPDPTLTGVTLADGTRLYFGQELAEVEILTGAKASAGSIRPAAGSAPNLKLSLREVTLEFEGGYLRGFGFRRFKELPAPFPELWKNLDPIDGSVVALGISERAVREYLDRWESNLGQQQLKRDRDYRIDESRTENSVSIFIRMASQRRAKSGRWIWDTWLLLFNPSGRGAEREQRLVSLEARRGELSTAQAAPAAQRRTETRELSKEAPKIELPPLELALPKVP